MSKNGQDEAGSGIEPFEREIKVQSRRYLRLTGTGMAGADKCYISLMTKRFEQAVAEIRKLPE